MAVKLLWNNWRESLLTWSSRGEYGTVPGMCRCGLSLIGPPFKAGLVRVLHHVPSSCAVVMHVIMIEYCDSVS